MLNFILGGVYTFVLVGISGFVGYLIGSKEFKKIVEQKISAKNSLLNQGGAVKMKTPSDFARDKDGEGRRIEELLS